MSDIIGNMPAALVDLDGRPIPKVGAASELAIEDRPKQLPDPSGYRILCAIPDIEKKTDGGIIKADEPRGVILPHFDKTQKPMDSFLHVRKVVLCAK